jgi:probable phosphoglycerate mutase
MTDNETIAILMVRHAHTPWNRQKLIQGRRDIELDHLGRKQAASWSLPRRYAGAPIYSSPLSRCVETARIIGGSEPIIDRRLIEMDWGDFEGHSLGGLRMNNPLDMENREAKGIGFDPPGGERPIDVVGRIEEFLQSMRQTAVVVCHKGVMRASMIIALEWNMRSKAPVRLGPDDAMELEMSLQSKIIAVNRVALR